MSQKTAPLFSRLGGKKAIEAAVKAFYARVFEDPELESFFTGIDRAWIERQQAKFFTQALGGPSIYDGADMTSAHARLSLENRHFDQVAGHLSEALTEVGVSEDLRDEVLAAVGPLRGEVVSHTSGREKSADINALVSMGAGGLLGTLSALQTNIFVADTSFELIYLNERAQDTLELIAEDIRSAFGVEINEIHGGSIHRFHRNPRLVERILRDPSALPHEAEFTFGRVTLSSTINSVVDDKGEVIGYVVNWEDVSKRVILEREQARVHSMMESAPTNVILADRDLKIRYLNEASKQTLRRLEEWLPIKTDEFMGATIDVFHRDPSHQRRIVGDPRNLPHKAVIDIGPEKVDLLASAIMDDKGEYLGPMITWEIITERLKIEQAMARTNSMMENAPTNVILADRNLNIQYMNPASVQTLRRLEEWLPIRVDEFIGASIDVFHRDPSHQRRLVGDPRNLPHKAVIDIGPEKVDLLASAIMDDKGEYLGPMITWEIITEKLETDRKLREMAEREKEQAEELRQKVDSLLDVVDSAAKGDLTRAVSVGGSDAIGKMGEGLGSFLTDLRNNIGDLATQTQDLSQAAELLSSVSHQMAGSADQTSSQANLVNEGAQQVNAHVKSVSAGVEEMNSSIRDVARSATEAAEVATNAVEIARDANETVSKLGQSSNEIGNVVRVITSIAQQTKLLALNATIEAARAGEAGKGFAVVANEVKELAKETANATEDISRKIEAIQGDTTGAIAAIEKIGQIIGEINELQNRIAGAVEQQSSTSNSVAQNLAEAALATDEITQNIAGVADAAGGTSKAASDTQVSAQDLEKLASELRKIVQRFTY